MQNKIVAGPTDLKEEALINMAMLFKCTFV
jgi:hypothetical protein